MRMLECDSIMKQYFEDIKKCISESDMIVVGLGNEWNISPKTQQSEKFQRIISDLENKPAFQWILPYVYFKMTDESLLNAYKTLFSLLEGKNYFVVTTTVNRSFISFAREGRVVMPCGSDLCMRDDTLSDSNDNREFLDTLESYIEGRISLEEVSFVRDGAGEVVPFNSVYATAYKEEGYLPKWNEYMRWLQGTMNRKTCLLELGAGLAFPSVFRFPFERMAFYNQKATCFRVHKTLYQLAEEMVVRSKSVPVHAVELFSCGEDER